MGYHRPNLTITASTASAAGLVSPDENITTKIPSSTRRRRQASSRSTSSSSSRTNTAVPPADNIPTDPQLAAQLSRPQSALSNYDFCDDEPLTCLSRPGSTASSYKDLAECSPSLSDSSDSNTLKKALQLKKLKKGRAVAAKPQKKAATKSVEDIFGSPPEEELRSYTPVSGDFLDPEDSEKKRLAAVRERQQKQEEEERLQAEKAEAEKG